MKATSLLRKTVFPAVLFLLPFFVVAQSESLNGVVTDSASVAMEGVTVLLLEARDSSMLQFTATDKQGRYDIKPNKTGTHLLTFSLLGYQTRFVPVGPGMPDTVQLLLNNTLLDELEISAKANAILLKKDTMEFNAGSFKTKPNAVLLDLLKKLPGVEVMPDGTIMAHGEEIKSILVDGKPFFGDDPSVASKNLPADAVSKIQLFDKKSDQAHFSGVDDGTRDKTINIKLKKDRQKGWIGNIGASGGGPGNRYETSTVMNRFGPKQQISINGVANNINQNDAYSGRAQNSNPQGGNSNDFGFNNTQNIGFSYGLKLNKMTDFNANYFISHNNRKSSRNSSGQSFLPTGTFNTAKNSDDQVDSRTHRGKMVFEHKFDTLHSIQITASTSWYGNESTGKSFSSSASVDSIPVNNSDRNSNSRVRNLSLQGTALYRHRFLKMGRNFSINVDGGINNSDNIRDLYSQNRFFGPEGLLNRVDTVAQNQLSAGRNNNLSSKLTFVEPLPKKMFLDASYRYYIRNSGSEREVYDTRTGDRFFVPDQSNSFLNRFETHRAGLGYRIDRKKLKAGVGTDYQYGLLSGETLSGMGAPISQVYRNLLPRMDARYEWDKSKNLSLNYNTDIRPPSVQQLQPVPDLSDPLNINEGNPDLKPEFTHNLRGGVAKVSKDKQRNFNINAGYFVTLDRIVNAQTIDSNFVRRNKPVNVGADYRVSFNGNYSFRVEHLKSRFNTQFGTGYSVGPNYINGLENITRNQSVTPSASWQFNPAEWLTLNAGANISWNFVRYSVGSISDQNYIQQRYTADFDLKLPRDWALNSNFMLSTNSGLSSGYNRAVPIWNAGITRYLLAKKQLEINVQVYDILNRNIGINRIVTPSYVEDQRSATLSRYGLLRCVYHLTSVDGKGKS